MGKNPIDATGNPKLIRAVARHIERHIGPVHFVFHEATPRLVHIDIHHVAPTEERPFHTLVTSGMSERRMRVPGEKRNHAFAELFLRLPPLNAVLERFVRHSVSEVTDPDRVNLCASSMLV